MGQGENNQYTLVHYSTVYRYQVRYRYFEFFVLRLKKKKHLYFQKANQSIYRYFLLDTVFYILKEFFTGTAKKKRYKTSAFLCCVLRCNSKANFER